MLNIQSNHIIQVSEELKSSHMRHVFTKSETPIDSRSEPFILDVKYTTNEVEDAYIDLSYRVGAPLENRVMSESFEVAAHKFTTKVFDYSTIIKMCDAVELPSTLFLNASVWSDFLTNDALTRAFDPITKYEYVCNGILGNLTINGRNIEVRTDAFEHPSHKFQKHLAVLLGANVGVYESTIDVVLDEPNQTAKITRKVICKAVPEKVAVLSLENGAV